MSDALTEMISEKLDILIKLMAISALSGKAQKEQIELLGKAGLPPKAIAELLGTTGNTVSVTLSRMKRSSKGGNLEKEVS